MKTRVILRYSGYEDVHEFEFVLQARAFLMLIRKTHPEWIFHEEQMKTAVDGAIVLVKTVTLTERKA